MTYWSFRACARLGIAAFLLVVPSPGTSETLSELATYALEHHPELRAREASVRAAGEATSPAHTWPDPQLSVGVMNVGATEWTVGSMDMAQASVQIAQEIPWRGKLGLSLEVAKADVTQAEAALAGARNRLAAEVALAALDIYELDRTIRIESEIRDTYQEMVRAAEGRFAVGEAMQQDVVSMMLDVDMSTVEINDARERRAALVAKLDGLLNRPVGAPFDSLTVAPLPSAPTDTAALVARALEDQPELARSRASVAQAEAMRELSLKNKVPNPMVMARYGNRGAKPGIYEIGVSIGLPVWSERRQNAEVRQAAAMLDMRRREKSAAELETTSMVGSVVARLRANERLLSAYGTALLPRAKQVVEASSAAYSVGQTSLIMVLDAVRKWHRLQREALEYEVMQRRMFVELEQMLGHAARIADGTASYVR